MGDESLRLVAARAGAIGPKLRTNESMILRIVTTAVQHHVNLNASYW